MPQAKRGEKQERGNEQRQRDGNAMPKERMRSERKRPDDVEELADGTEAADFTNVVTYSRRPHADRSRDTGWLRRDQRRDDAVIVLQFERRAELRKIRRGDDGQREEQRQ